MNRIQNFFEIKKKTQIQTVNLHQTEISLKKKNLNKRRFDRHFWHYAVLKKKTHKIFGKNKN